MKIKYIHAKMCTKLIKWIKTDWGRFRHFIQEELTSDRYNQNSPIIPHLKKISTLTVTHNNLCCIENQNYSFLGVSLRLLLRFPKTNG